MNIQKPWEFEDGQYITSNNRKYNIHAALMLAKDLPQKTLNIKTLYRDYCAPCENSFMEFVKHMKAVVDANLQYPILLNEDGLIIDGRHRLAKALLKGHVVIQCIQFDVDPPACYEEVK